MATIADSGYPNLVNFVKRMAPSGSVEAMLADTLSKELPMLMDMPIVEGNLPTGHRITAVNALPSPTWRKLNQGINPTKGETLQYEEACGMLEAHSKIDVAGAELNGNQAAYRASEDKLFIEGLSQEAARALIYESVASNSERIHGLTPRYPATTGYQASGYVIKSGTPASANSQSIWAVSWDPDRIFGIVPKGSIAGLSSEDLGKKFVRDANSLDFLAYVTRFVWKLGLAVKDYRYAVRLQWDPSDGGQVDTAKLLYLSLQNAIGTLWKTNKQTRLYMSRTSRNKLAAQLASNSVNYLEWATGPEGDLIEHFIGIPIRLTDSLIGETAIS